ncbi:MAG: CCA tRNA nucleotidyltransferase [Ruminococcus sp.]|nr:CCA tRNA nucleotidyltransferase [Ruminococcus sp.]
MQIDKNTAEILGQLEKNGFEAYIVGGCVRDILMGREIHDTDITTNALPEQIISVFSDCRTIPTGIKHGTVTVIRNSISYEITTYRIDGEYKDSRRPETVEFTADITNDLSRRDFTMNALAMDKNGNIIDEFGGAEDIKNGIIRCVGEPEKRFTEDALRIMRAVRFASQLGFEIEENTANAVHSMKDRLKNISNERIREELDKLICGKNSFDVLMNYSDIITTVIPELQASVGFDQHSPYHKYTVWEHTVRALCKAPNDDLKLRRVMLFHDIAKPYCATFDKNGRGHFKKHDVLGGKMAVEIMKRLRYDNETIKYTDTIISNHNRNIISRNDIKKLMCKIGDDNFFELMHMKRCDNSAKNDFVNDDAKLYDTYEELGRRIIENNECRHLRDLAVNGSELSIFGLKGKEIGNALTEILELVICGYLDNNKSELMKYAEGRWNK